MRDSLKSMPNPNDAIVRLNYRGFLSAVWMLWKMNRSSRSVGVKTEARIVLPLPWLK